MTLEKELEQSLIGPPRLLPTGEMECLFCFTPGFSGFQGHFPEFPVLPGVVQIMAAVLTAGRGSAGTMRLAGLKRCKFTRPVRPMEKMRVRVLVDKGVAKAFLTAEEEPCAAFSLYLEEAGV